MKTTGVMKFLALRVVQCTKKHIWAPLSSYENIHLFSDSSFKPLASGYLGKCMNIFNTMGLVVCDDIIVRTPSLCTWQCYSVICILYGLALHGCTIQKEGKDEATLLQKTAVQSVMRFLKYWCRTSEKRDHARLDSHSYAYFVRKLKDERTLLCPFVIIARILAAIPDNTQSRILKCLYTKITTT